MSIAKAQYCRKVADDIRQLAMLSEIAKYISSIDCLIDRPLFRSFSDELSSDLLILGVERGGNPAVRQSQRNRLISLKGSTSSEASALYKSMKQKTHARGVGYIVSRCYDLSAASYHEFCTGNHSLASDTILQAISLQMELLTNYRINSVFAHYCQLHINLIRTSGGNFRQSKSVSFAIDYVASADIRGSYAVPTWERLKHRLIAGRGWTYGDFLDGYDELADVEKIIVILSQPIGIASLFELRSIAKRNSESTFFSEVGPIFESKLEKYQNLWVKI